jgi:hypothetical protein
VVITNTFGADTRVVATLTVDSPTNVTILVQPYGDTVPAGGYYSFSVVAAGLPTLLYQWLFNGVGITDATNRSLTFTNVAVEDAGKSQVLQIHLASSPSPPAGLTGLKSFSLQAGLPRFSVGVIEFVDRQPGGIVQWALHGEPGFVYVVEKSSQPHDRIWQPFVVLTNQNKLALCLRKAQTICQVTPDAKAILLEARSVQRANSYEYISFQ